MRRFGKLTYETPYVYTDRPTKKVAATRIQPRTFAGGGARTHTILRSLDFESSASANSATPASQVNQRVAAIFLARVLLFVLL